MVYFENSCLLVPMAGLSWNKSRPIDSFLLIICLLSLCLVCIQIILDCILDIVNMKL